MLLFVETGGAQSDQYPSSWLTPFCTSFKNFFCFFLICFCVGFCVGSVHPNHGFVVPFFFNLHAGAFALESA